MNIGAVETVLPDMAGVTYVVTSLGDTVAADGVVTLREALAAANTNQAVGDAAAGSYSSADRIEFAAGLTGTILTNGKAYQILSSVDLVGPGASQLTLDAGGSSGVLSIPGLCNVNVSGLTLTGGNATNGGGVYSSGANLTLNDLVISGNRASFTGGNTVSSCGGGLYANYGISTLTNVTISGNISSNGHGGGLFLSYNISTLTNVTISGNTASSDVDAFGGGSYQFYGTSTLTNVTISGNTAKSGGGLYQSYGSSTLTNVTISGNTASTDGGGLYQGGGISTLTNVTISRNAAPSNGGGFYLAGTSTLKNTVVARNIAWAGPDIYSSGGTFSGANNLIGDGTGQTSLVNGVSGNLVGTAVSPIDAMLAEDTRFGIALSPLPGSPAIDAGDDSLIPPGISADVYGAARIQGARVNIGAVETVLPDMAGVTYVVTSLGDTVAADGVVTLREALAAANTNQAVGDAAAGSYSSADRIEFAAGLTGTILTNGKAYQILSSVDLVGPGASQLTLDAGGSSGVLSIPGLCNVNVSGLTLTGGNATNGGGVYSSGANLTLNDLVISGNRASYGGGLYANCSISALANVTVIGNTASSSGGGLYANRATSTLTNVTISGNTASSNGGGLYQTYGTSTLTNVTIGGNSASSRGGGLYLSSATSTLKNTIVARNTASTGPDLYRSSGTLSGANNLIRDGTGQTALVNGVSGNLVGTTASPIDPLFVNMVGTDWTQWNLRLRLDSPAVNSGDNAWIPAGITTDIAGGPRILDGTVEMGAYEFNAGDVNHDGKADGLDLSLLGANWQSSSTDGDLNGDGFVDGIDLSLLGANWQVGVVEAMNVSSAESASPMAAPEPPSIIEISGAVEVTPSDIIETAVTQPHQPEAEPAALIHDDDIAGSMAGSSSGDTIFGSDGIEVVESDDPMEAVYAAAGSEMAAEEPALVGLFSEAAMADDGRGVISSGDGNDMIVGEMGNETIYAEPGDDYIADEGVASIFHDRVYASLHRVSWDDRDSIFDEELNVLK